MTFNRTNTALLVIDMQEKLIPAMYEAEALVDNTVKLISVLNILDIPIISTIQYSKGLGQTVAPIKTLLPKNDFQDIEKDEFSCVKNNIFFEKLDACSRQKILVVGIESHICVQQTVLDLMDEDFHPIVIADCVSSRKQYDKKFALKRMGAYGADITTYESAIFELIGTSKAKEFKEISKIIK